MSLEREWLTLGQAADAAGRSRRTIERWISDERLPALVVLGRTRVNELQLLQVERDTRRAARRGRPGPRTPDNLTMGVVSSTQSRGTTPGMCNSAAGMLAEDSARAAALAAYLRRA